MLLLFWYTEGGRERSMDLRKKVVEGLGWSAAASLVNQALNAGTKIIVARLLFPADFGVFAMALILINFLSLFTGFGFMSAMIYKKEDPEKTLGTAFMLSFVFGAILFVVSFFSSGFIASFFNHSELKLMIEVLSVCFIFDSLSYIMSGSLLKNLEFKRKTIVDVVSACLYGFLVIMLAYLEFGVWSLIIGYIVQRLVVILLLLIISPQKLRFVFDKEIAKEIMHFGKYVAATSLFAWFIISIDNIVVGKMLGDESLGYYSFAFTIASLPVLSITHIFNTVFHPVYASLQDDKARLKKAYLQSMEISLLFILPITIGLYLTAEKFVLVLLGEKWASMIIILKILSIYCIFRAVCSHISQLLEGIGMPKNASLLLLAESIILLILLMPGIYFFGLVGVAFAVLLARAISMVLHIIQLNRVFSVSIKEYAYFFWKNALAALVMGIIVFVEKQFLTDSSILNIILLVASGVIVYGSIVFFLKSNICDQIKELRGA